MTTSTQFSSGCREACKTAHGAEFSEETFQKALSKLKLHIRNKYGSLDYTEETSESGFENILSFYTETVKLASGAVTFNNGRAGLKSSKQARFEAFLARNKKMFTVGHG